MCVHRDRDQSDMKRSKHLISIISLLLAYFAPGQAIDVYGQKGTFDFPLEESYQKAQNLRHTRSGAILADSLYKIAEKNRNPEMQTKLLRLSIEYYVTTPNIEKVREKCELLRTIAQKNKDENDVFWSHRQLAKYLIDHGRMLESMDLVNEMKNDADEMKSALGTYMMHLTLGDIYKACNDKDMAKESYLQALNLQKRYLKNMDPTMSHVYLSEMYRRKSGRTDADLDSCRLLLAEGLSLTTDPMNRARLLAEEAMLFHSIRDYQSFNETYQRMLSELGTDTLPDEFLQVYYRKKFLDGDYEEAQKLIDRMPSDYDRHIAQYLLYKRKGDYQKAMDSYEDANHALNIQRSQQSRMNMEEWNLRIGNLQLEVENIELEHRFDSFLTKVLSVIFIIVLIAFYFMSKLWNKARNAGKQLQIKNQELEQARDKAVRSEASKTLFIQNMSHEIRTPLNAIVGFSEILATHPEEIEPSEREKFKNQIKHNNEILTNLVECILTSGDLDNADKELNLGRVRVNQLCRDVIESVRHRVRSNVEVELESDVSDKLEIMSDAPRLTLVLNNLLVNAGKYTTEGRISLECKIRKGMMIFAVSDTGPGIPPEARMKIFEKFTKLDRFHQGTGLGLYICRTIVEEMMEGKIYYDGNYTGGSRFVVELPLIEEEEIGKNTE